MKRYRSAMTKLLLLLTLGIVSLSAIAQTGFNLDVDPGIRVVDNSDGSSDVSTNFQLFNGQAPSDALRPGDFFVKVDGQLVAATILQPPVASAKADVVFCMDVSGSMWDEIQAVKNNTAGFVNKLNNGNFDVRLGLITFGAYPAPYLAQRNNGQFYSSTQDFINEVGTLSAYGGTEEWFDCLVQASQYPYRPGAERVTILITDEPGDNGSHTIDTAMPVVVSNASKVYGISYGTLGTVVRAVNDTNGDLYNITDPFDTILDKIAASILNTYKVSLRGTFSPGIHWLRVEPIQNTTGGDEEPFKIAANPVIALTPATQTLVNNGVTPGSGVDIIASVIDPDGGSIRSVNITWEDATNNTVSQMSPIGADTYQFTYPGTLNNSGDCLSFSIQAIDDEGRSTVVPMNANGQWTICAASTVITINSITPSSYSYQQSISVQTEIAVDIYSFGTTAQLFYREIGNPNWSSVQMVNSFPIPSVGLYPDMTFSASLPATIAGFNGIELEVVITDDSGAEARKLQTLTVSQIPVVIVDVTRRTDTTDTGPFSIQAVVAGVDTANQGSVNLSYTINGGVPISVPMTLAVTGTSSPMQVNSNIYVESIPAVSAGDMVCYVVEASNPTNNVQSTQMCFDVLQPAAPLGLTPNSAILAIGDSPIEIMATGGYGTYSWSTLNGDLSTTLGDKTNYTPKIIGLDKVSVTDLRGFTSTAVINVLPALSIDPAVDGQRFSPSSSVVLTASGGEPPYQWQVDGAASAQESGSSNEQVDIALGADPATISVKVIDSRGREESVTFTNNGVLRVSPDTEVLVALGSETTFTVTGGDGSYVWTTIGGDVDNPSAASVTYKAPNMAGVYHLTVSDGSGDSASVIIKVGQPLRVTPLCARRGLGDSVTFDVVSGVGTLWQADFGQLSSTSGNQVTYTPEHIEGVYEVRVFDNTGAVLPLCVEVSEVLRTTISSISLDINESKELNAVGGIGTLTWTTVRGSFDVTTGGTVLYTAPAEVGSGTDTVTVTDDAGATATVSVTIGSGAECKITPSQTTVTPEDPNNLKVTLTAVNCKAPISWIAASGSLSTTAGDVVEFTAPSGFGNYDVTLSDGEGKTAKATITVSQFAECSLTPSNPTVVVGEKVKLITENCDAPISWTTVKGTLSPTTGASVDYTAPNETGSYVVTVTDGAGKKLTANVNVVLSSVSLKITPQAAQLLEGETQSLTVVGGKAPYTWRVDGEGSLSATTGISVIYTPPSLIPPNLSDSAVVEVTDDTGIKATTKIYVTQKSQDLSITPAQVTLSSGGTQTFTVNNAVGDIRWTATQGEITQSGEYTAPASSGVYTVTAFDFTRGANVTATVSVTSQLAMTPSTAVINTGDSTSFTVMGGEEPYNWHVIGGGFLDATTGGTVSFTADSSAGESKLVVIDNRGVSGEAIVTIAGTMSCTPNDVTLPPGQSQSFTVSGGSGAMTWTAEQGNVDANGNYTAPQNLGTYAITARDNAGNQAVCRATVANVPVITPALGWLEQNGSMNFTVIGGTGPYCWTASSGRFFSSCGSAVTYTAPSVSNEVTVTVEDNLGQKFEATVYVDLPLLATKGEIFIEPGQTSRVAVTGGIPAFDWSTIKGDMDKVRTEDAGFNFYTAPNVAGEDTITIRDKAGRSTTVAVYVALKPKVTPNIRYMKRESSKTFTMVRGTPPYTAIVKSGDGDISPTQSNDGIFTFTSGTTADNDVVIEFSDNTNQTVTAHAFVERQLTASSLALYVDKSSTAKFSVTGGTGDFFVQAESGFADIDPVTGTGTYEAPNRYGTYDLTVIDSSDQSITITAQVERMIPVISPIEPTLAVGETATFVVSRGAPSYEWSFAGGVPTGKNSENSVVQVTMPKTAGDYKLDVEDGAGNMAEATVHVFQPLMLSPASYTAYTGENPAVRFNMLGGSPPCDWILTDLEEVRRGDNYIVVRPRTEVEGNTYEVACRDQNGDIARTNIVVSRLPGDINGDGEIDSDEAFIIINNFFMEDIDNVTIDMKSQIFRSLENFISN